LSTGYANLCDLVFSPSESIASVLIERGVRTPIEVIPTGVQTELFRNGDGNRFRRKAGIPENAFVIGHLGRLAPEKNLDFLAHAVARYLEKDPKAHFLIVGVGPSAKGIVDYFEQRGLSNRLHMEGLQSRQSLVDSYHAMDVFAFASQSETQGMVLTEAMASGVPIVAVDAPGVREVVKDRLNGRLLPHENVEEFVSAISWMASLSSDQAQQMKKCIDTTVDHFSLERCCLRALSHYESLMLRNPNRDQPEGSLWSKALRTIESEWEIWANRAHAAGTALHITGNEPPGHHD
jgi:glycosyltransferase involved in cell wall biosynthesis